MRSSSLLVLASASIFATAHGLLDAGEITTVSVSANAYDQDTSGSGCSPSGCVASNTRDGSLDDNSRWSCSADLLSGQECAITYDFQATQDIVEVWIAFTYGDTRTRSVEVYLDNSLDATFTSSGTTDGYEVFTLNSAGTSSLSLVSTGLASDEWLSLTEVVFMVEGTLEYQAVGCYGDTKSDRVLTFNSYDLYLMTPDLCAARCEGYASFGTQYARECWCGESGIDYDRHGSATCNYACTGDSSTNCGGYDAISLYSYDDETATPAPTPSSLSGYLGCFQDVRSDRVLTDKYADSSLTPQSCADRCEGLGKQFSGLQYGQECWCGECDLLEDGTRYDRYGEGSCNMECSGDPLEACGGYFAFDLYLTGTCG